LDFSYRIGSDLENGLIKRRKIVFWNQITGRSLNRFEISWFPLN